MSFSKLIAAGLCAWLMVGVAPSLRAAPLSPQSEFARRVVGAGGSLPDGLWRSAGVEIQVDRTERSLAERIPAWLIDLRVRTGLTGVRSLGRAARVVLGSRASADARTLATLIGAEIDDRGFSYAGERFEHPTARLIGCLEDPERPGLPVTVAFGNDPHRLSAGLLELPVYESPGVEIWSEGRLVWTGDLNSAGELQGELRPHAADLHLAANSLVRYPSNGIDLWSEPPTDPKRLRAYFDHAAQAEERVILWFGPDDGAETMLLVHNDPRVVGRFAGLPGGALYAVNHEVQRVHVCVTAGLPDDGGAGVAIARAISIAGPPGRSWMLDALGAAASGKLRGLKLEKIVASWLRDGANFEIDELFTRESLRRPPGSRDGVLRAFAFKQLASSVDSHELRRLWRDGVPLHIWRDLAPSLRAGLAKLADSSEQALPRGIPDETFAGAVLSSESIPSMEGTSQYGYWVDGLGERCEALRTLGANGVILEFRPTLLQVEPLRGGPGAFADRSLDDMLEMATAVRQAQQAGLRVGVLLSPIAGAASGWPDQAAVSAQNVQRFVERYWARLDELASHAESLNVEFLVLGKGLREVTSTRVQEGLADETKQLIAARRAGWETLIARTRRVFSGALGYAVRVELMGADGWAEFVELDGIGFWAKLDFALLDCVPCWEKRPQSARGIERDLKRMIDQSLGGRADLPLFLLGGTPSTSEAWRFCAAVGVADLGWQRMFGQGLTGEFVRSKQQRELVGAAWSHVSADPDVEEPIDSDPLGSPAERELEELLRGLKRP